MQICQKIICQTSIFNIFPSSVPQNTVAKILQSNCLPQSKKYVPIHSLWLNRLFTDLPNSHEKQSLTIDCGNKNKNGPGRYRSSADNPVEQVSYFNKPNDDEYYVFISKRIKEGDFSEGIYFKIEKVRGKTDKENYDTKKALEDGASNDRFLQIFSISKPEQCVEQAQAKDMEILLGTFTEEIGSQQDRNFSQDYNNKKNNRKQKERSNYSNTEVKARNLLTNVSYRRFKQSDFLNDSFIIDLLSFIVQNLAPINLDQKFDDEREKCMVKFIWDECIQHDFTRFINKQDNFLVKSNLKLTYQKTNAVVKEFIKEDPNRINILKYKIEKKL